MSAQQEFELFPGGALGTIGGGATPTVTFTIKGVKK